MRDDAVNFSVKDRFTDSDIADLRYAIGLRRAGVIDSKTDSVLGRLLQNMGRLAVCSMIHSGSLTLKTRRDADFDADVTLYAVNACDDVDLCRSGLEIFSYIVERVKSRIKDRIRYGSRKKRSAVLEPIGCTVETSDFYGGKTQGLSIQTQGAIQ